MPNHRAGIRLCLAARTGRRDLAAPTAAPDRGRLIATVVGVSGPLATSRRACHDPQPVVPVGRNRLDPETPLSSRPDACLDVLQGRKASMSPTVNQITKRTGASVTAVSRARNRGTSHGADVSASRDESDRRKSATRTWPDPPDHDIQPMPENSAQPVASRPADRTHRASRNDAPSDSVRVRPLPVAGVDAGGLTGAARRHYETECPIAARRRTVVFCHGRAQCEDRAAAHRRHGQSRQRFAGEARP